MPIYTYLCDNCGVQFEKQQSFNDQPLYRCPECGKKTLRKVYQPVGIVFKGSGFYATDHHSPSGAAPLKEEKKNGGGNKESGTGEPKADSKNEKKSDEK